MRQSVTNNGSTDERAGQWFEFARRLLHSWSESRKSVSWPQVGSTSYVAKYRELLGFSLVAVAQIGM